MQPDHATSISASAGLACSPDVDLGAHLCSTPGLVVVVKCDRYWVLCRSRNGPRASRSRIERGTVRTSGHHDSLASSPAATAASTASATPLRRSETRTISGAKPPSADWLW